MADASSAATPSNSNSNSCWIKVLNSQLTDLALLTGFVALLIIGILASKGSFNAISTTNATYLSYGMYSGAALFLIAEVIKIVVNYCQRIRSKDQIVIHETQDVSDVQAQAHPPLTQAAGLQLLNDAAQRGDADAVSNLLGQGIAPGIGDVENMDCTIGWAIDATQGDPIAVLRHLFARDPGGASRQFKWGTVHTSPLHQAVVADRPDIVQLLIEHHADLEKIIAPEMRSGATPLLLALWMSGIDFQHGTLPNLEIVEALSRAGADPDAYPRGDSDFNSRYLLSKWEHFRPEWAQQNRDRLDAIKGYWVQHWG